jgi:hypothetical protein
MKRRALFGSAVFACAVLVLAAGCNDTRRDWDVCHVEPCQDGFFCNAQQRCVPIIPASADAGADGSRPDGSLLAEGGDAGDGSIDAGASGNAEASSDATGDAALQDGSGADVASDATEASDAPAG